MSLVKHQQNNPEIFDIDNARKKMELIANESLPHCILLICGYVRMCIENGCKDITIPKCVIQFILKGLNALKASSDLKPYFLTPIEKLPGWKSGIISLQKVVEALNIDEYDTNTNSKHPRAYKASYDAEQKNNDSQSGHVQDTDTLVIWDEAKQKRDKLVSTLSKILVKLCDANQNIPYANNDINRPFYYRLVPQISIHDYLIRIAYWSRCTDDVFIIALVYIDKLIKRKNAMINMNTVHKFILIAIMEATKFQDDIHYNNKTWAQIGGIELGDLNKLEIHFLYALDFDLNVDFSEYKMYSDRVSRFC